jgi:hypothetical protein
MEALTKHEMCKRAAEANRAARQRGSSTTIPTVIVPFNIVANIPGTVAVKR